MKKTFCDSCGDEFDYKDITMSAVNGVPRQVKLPAAESMLPRREMAFMVHIRIEPDQVNNGEHIDICGGCRWKMLDELYSRPEIHPER
jgi:hypothetical protein